MRNEAAMEYLEDIQNSIKGSTLCVQPKSYL